MKERIKKWIQKKSPGDLSIAYAVVCLLGVTIFMLALTEYNNYLVVRHLEAVSDLAAVEAVRAYVDEEELRNEKLVIKDEDVPKIRDLFLEKVRTHVPPTAVDIVRIEIPTIENGVITIPEDYHTAEFPNSTSTAFVNMGDQMENTQQWYLLGGNTPGTAAAALVRDTSNINTASDKPKTSYIFTAKITVIYDTLSIFSRPGGNILNFVDIFTDEPVSITTVKEDPKVNCITIETQGKVTLR